MCGRYVLDATPAMMAASFDAVDRLGVLTPTFNAAPGQLLPVIVPTTTGRVLERAPWGLVPPADVEVPGRPQGLVNARAEVLGRSPAHRHAFRTGRCLVPATGFYEWAVTEDPVEEQGESAEGEVRLFDPGPAAVSAPRKRRTTKVPWCFGVGEGELFAFAAVAADVADAEGQARRTFAIVTTRPNPLVAPVHDRMPLILPPGSVDIWLNGSPDEARSVVASFPQEQMRAYPVSTMVNDVRNDGPELITPAAVG